MKFRFGTIEIDEIDGQSGLYYGRNYQHDVTVSKKENQGFGDLNGESNFYVNNVEVIFDDDEVDAPYGSDGGEQDE